MPKKQHCFGKLYLCASMDPDVSLINKRDYAEKINTKCITAYK